MGKDHLAGERLDQCWDLFGQRLRNLERDGLVSRKVYAEVPPRVEYTLTDLGRDLLQPLHSLRVWVQTHLPVVLAARETRTTRCSIRACL
jgi:DNA-binding HxlR family transcriptional regulator